MTIDKTPTDAPLNVIELMKTVMQADDETRAFALRGTTNWAAYIGKAVHKAVLAKWGSPVVAGEPVAPDFYTACAWHEGGGVGGWIALPGYSNETERGVKHLVLEAARKEGYKGTAAGRLLELGWEIRPVYLAPQPTQAQAGAVPQYRLLESRVDRIEASDEFLQDDAQTWATDPYGVFVGILYGCALRAARRRIKEGGQHADQ